MLNTTAGKRAQTLALTMVLSILLASTTTLAATRIIRANRGGIIRIAQGVKLVIRHAALERDTMISADMVREHGRVCFCFGSDGTAFADDKPAELRISWQAIDDVDDPVLYGDNGEEIEPDIAGWGLRYYIGHFPMYYYRRR